MSKRPSRSRAKAKTGDKNKPATATASATQDVEKPLPPADQLRTPAEERLEETDQTMTADGTTPRHREPLGPPAPGQQGRPGPERRVRPANYEMTNEHANPVGDSPEELAEYKATLGKVIRVRAKQTGYIDHVRRRPGDVFDVREKEFSKRWMEVVDGTTPPKTTGAQKSIAAKNAETRGQRLEEKATGVRAPRSSGDRDVLD